MSAHYIEAMKANEYSRRWPNAFPLGRFSTTSIRWTQREIDDLEFMPQPVQAPNSQVPPSSMPSLNAASPIPVLDALPAGTVISTNGPTQGHYGGNGQPPPWIPASGTSITFDQDDGRQWNYFNGKWN